MDTLIIVLRLLHVVGGVLWVGFAAFNAFFLGPAMQDAGPDAGKIMVGLQRRGLMIVSPLIALVTLVSGFWLYLRMGSGFMSTPVGLAFGTGGVLALLTFIVGIVYVMPSMRRAARLTQTLAGASERDRAAGLAEIQRIRVRSGAITRIVGVVLILVAAIMATARYV